MLTSAAALGFAGPALAKPGHGFGHGDEHGYSYRGDDDGQHFGDRGRDADDVDEDEDLDEGIRQQAFGYGVGGCPPGLAKKSPACIPPGLARRQQQVLGQSALGYGVPYGAPVPYGAYGNPYGYGAYGNPYGAAPVPYGAYGYGAPYSGYPYQVDPRTVLLQQVIGALAR